MEQLGPAIQFVSKHRFWFVTGLVTLLAVGVWFFASSRLSSQRMAAQYNIQQQIDDLNKIKKTSANLTTPDGSPAEQVLAHPNDTTKQGMNQEIQESLRSMLAAWKMRREAQESILQWPLEVLDSKDFVNMFSQFDPPEKFASIPDTGFSNLLTIYKDSIPRRMPAICDIIGAKWYFTPPAGAAGSTPQSGQASQGAARDGMQITGSSEVDTRTYTVQWNKDNQALWHEKLTRFKDIDGNKKEYPSPYQVLALQQDLWLLEAMFKIIKEINGDETASDFATIKSIYYVVFGREARMDAKRELITPDPRLASRQEETSRPTFNPDDDPRGGMPGAPTRESDEPVGTPFDPKLTEMVELGPFHGRYVDRFFQPIPIKTIHDVLNSNTLPDQYLELIVAKRVPVRIAIRMDERRIADFIAACRNSPFAFEIELVRVNCDVKGEDIKVYGGAAASASGADRGAGFVAGGGAAGSAGASASDVDSPGSGGSGAQGGLDGANLPVEVRTNYDVNVEFFGVVKIYNKLGKEEEARFRSLMGDDTNVTSHVPPSAAIASTNRN